MLSRSFAKVSGVARLLLLGVILSGAVVAREPDAVIDLWPGPPPGETTTLPSEADTTTASGRLVAGRRVIRLGNVSTPQLAVYQPSKDKDTGAAVVICPGGGFNILAYDLEGTEVADWLNSIGVTGVVLKYRVPFRDPQKRWLAALQDTQRAIRLVRSRADEWRIDPQRLGVLGFSAGGAAAALASITFDQQNYPAADAIDQVSSRPDFALLIYPGGALIDRGETRVRDDVKVPANVPPIFLVHAFDDTVPVYTSLSLATEIKKAGGSAEVHIYDAGGHGYGLRHVPEFPVTTWPRRAEEWLARRGVLQRK